jgi:hypothetical protein
MPITIIADPGAANANSYETYAEANTYFEQRIPITPAWAASGNEAYLLTATKVLDALAQPFKTLIPAQGSVPAYYRIRRQWTGQRATATQVLAWPRIGMYDQNGNEIASTVIPQALKDAESELAGSLLKGDRMLDNDVIIQGLTSMRAGSVSLGFKDNIVPQVIPDYVYNLMPQSWLTDELYEPALQAQFDVVSFGSTNRNCRRST